MVRIIGMDKWKASGKTSVLAVFFFLLCYFVHFGAIWKYAVNIPSMDEWEALNDNALIAPSFRWFFAKHNEHMIAPTKLLAWLLLHLNGWNIRSSILLSFGIFGLLVASVVVVGRRLMFALPLWAVLAFCLFLLSTLPSENHMWGFQSQFHFFLLFKVIAILFLFDSRQGWPAVFLGTLALAASIVSFSAGVASAAALLAIFVLFKWHRFSKIRGWDKRELQQLVFTVTITAVVMLFWWSVPGPSVPFSYPTGMIFWRMLFRMVGWGYGLFAVSPFPVFLGFLFAGALPLLLIWRRSEIGLTEKAMITACIGSTLAELSAISLGRGYFGQLFVIYRYTEVAFLLVPWSAFAWAMALEKEKIARSFVLAGLWIFFAVNFSAYLGTEAYEGIRNWRRHGVDCLESANRRGGEIRCEALYPGPLNHRLENARVLNISFTRR